MPAAFIVNTKDGDKLVVASTVTSVDFKEGKPGEPAVEAQDAVEDDPGVEANPAIGHPGRPPVKGHPKIEAKPAVAGEPSVVTFKTEGGSVEAIGMTLAQAAELINR
jgi:hypothetical protein